MANAREKDMMLFSRHDSPDAQRPATPRGTPLRAFLFALSTAVASSACGSSSPEIDEGETSAAFSGSYAVGTKLQTTANVNLRASPSPNATVLDVIPRDTVVASASAHPVAFWYGVTYGATTGWVSGAYLRVAAPGSGGGSGHYSRESVYAAIVDRRTCSGGAASDVLDADLTTQQLVDAVGWVADHATIDWGFCVINTGHHYDPEAHSSGYAIDLFANGSSNDAAMVKLVDEDPYFVEIGVSGDYVAQRYLLTDPSKCSFVENAPTHIHAAVHRAFC